MFIYMNHTTPWTYIATTSRKWNLALFHHVHAETWSCGVGLSSYLAKKTRSLKHTMEKCEHRRKEIHFLSKQSCAWTQNKPNAPRMTALDKTRSRYCACNDLHPPCNLHTTPFQKATILHYQTVIAGNWQTHNSNENLLTQWPTIMFLTEKSFFNKAVTGTRQFFDCKEVPVTTAKHILDPSAACASCWQRTCHCTHAFAALPATAAQQKKKACSSYTQQHSSNHVLYVTRITLFWYANMRLLLYTIHASDNAHRPAPHTMWLATYRKTWNELEQHDTAAGSMSVASCT